MQSSGVWRSRERHYDNQALQHESRSAALTARRSGPLYGYKRYANAVKRRLIEQYAANANLLVDVGCGRGGDIDKWRGANVRRVLAMDLSGAQLEEARIRERQGGHAKRAQCQIEFVQLSMMERDLASRLGVAGTADAAAAQFAVQYAFGSEAAVSALLAQVSALLREGGVFFGTAPDGEAIAKLLRQRGDQNGALRIAPPEAPFVLRLELRGGVQRGGGADGGAAGGAAAGGGGAGGAAAGGAAAGGGGAGGGAADGGGADGGGQDEGLDRSFGQELLFSLEDTVTEGSGEAGCSEYLLLRPEFARLADAQGLQMVEMATMLQPPPPPPPPPGMAGVQPARRPPSKLPSLTEAEALVAGLYFSFAFRKRCHR